MASSLREVFNSTTMTVFHKIVVLKSDPKDGKDPTRPLRKELRNYLGIDMIPLYHTEALNQITVELVCSDNDPEHHRTMKDIDNLLMRFEVIKELDDHRNAPTKHMNHLMQISQKKDETEDTEETKEIERG
jgi:hypothetical protein